MEENKEVKEGNSETEKKDELSDHFKCKKGGIITMPFIFANEFCEKLAVDGFGNNMVNYLTLQLHMPLTKAANTVTNFKGTASLTPLLGAFVADSYAGPFWTVTVASITYQIAMVCLTISAALPQLRPPPCAGNEVCQEANSKQMAILYFSLLLAAIGSGGIRPCVAAFGANQFVGVDSKHKTNTCVFFNWYYFVMGASMLLASTVLVYIQDNVGWGWGLGIPTVAMLLSIPIFVLGYPLYRFLDPAGSPFTRFLQVIVAAFRKRKVPMVSDPKMLYQNQEIDAPFSADGMLHHTKQFEFLDKAAIVTVKDVDLKSSQKPNFWRLNTVHRVEELKSIIRMLPIWAAGIIFFTAFAQQQTFSLQQANTMDRQLTKSFQIPAASMNLFTVTSMLTTIVFYDRVFVPFASKFTGLNQGITFLHRMGIGFFISIFATLVAGFIEVKRKRVGLATSTSTLPISVFWLVPQYSLHGISEAFMAIGHLEFFYDQAPESMRSTATALFWTANSAGYYASTLLVSLVTKFSAGPNGKNWLPDHNLNKGKLEYFYWLITCLQVPNFVYYFLCAKFFTFKSLHIQTDEGDHDWKGKGLELENGV
ncbi:protein NRT1/ PTR FAMILY 3.1-like [Alnus glutinosa]|uniref:protein NRT1/ PTR FAMILY 3.1-like n=1 Tax=Alnus glutinosa TaxID=3517 RepID=UPI002D7755F8|nr:protein NRT1/ PTR FAMILY 3.1-like [Alnus glutinosa]